MYETPQFINSGDQAILVEFGDSINPDINDRVQNLMIQLEKTDKPWLVDLVPSYKSLLVIFDPTIESRKNIQNEIFADSSKLKDLDKHSAKVIQIPTLYGGEFGQDLEFVAKHSGLSENDVVSLHSKPYYRVYMIGFAPGFPYLGGLDKKLATPRLESPRIRIPSGSVGIAESQTGIYPNDSPGGWQLIGRTPLSLFDPMRENPSLLVTGNYIKFQPLENLEAYLDVRSNVESNSYKPEIEILDDEEINRSVS